MNKIQNNLIEEDLIKNAKRKIKFRILNLSITNEYFINSIMLKIKKRYDFNEYLKEIKKIDAIRLKEVAIKYFPKNKNDKKFTIIIRDPTKK